MSHTPPYQLGQQVWCLQELRGGEITDIKCRTDTVNDSGSIIYSITFTVGEEVIVRDSRCITGDYLRVISLLQERVVEYRDAFWREKQKN